jgi:hypothetical protein
MGFYQEIISMFIIYWVPVLYILGRFCILGAKIWGKKCPPFGKNLMGFYQEIISMFILYWVPVLYILGRFCILGAKIWGKKCTLLWQKFDGILPRNHINVHQLCPST